MRWFLSSAGTVKYQIQLFQFPRVSRSGGTLSTKTILWWFFFAQRIQFEIHASILSSVHDEYQFWNSTRTPTQNNSHRWYLRHHLSTQYLHISIFTMRCKFEKHYRRNEPIIHDFYTRRVLRCTFQSISKNDNLPHQGKLIVY